MDSVWTVCGSTLAIEPFERRKVEGELAKARDRFRGCVEPLANLGITFPDVHSDAEMASLIEQRR